MKSITVHSIWQLRLQKLTKILVILAIFSIPISTSATDILFPLIFLLTLLTGQWQEKWRAIFRNPILICFALLIFLYFIGVFYSFSPFHMAFKYFLKYLPFLFLLFAAPLFMERKIRVYVINTFLFSILLTLILSYVRIIIHGHFGTRLGAAEFDTIFKNHIDQSFLFSVAAFFSFYRFLNPSDQSRRFIRWLYLVFTVLLLMILMLFSQSRTGYVVAGILFLYTFFDRYGWDGFFGAVIVGIIGVGILFYTSHAFQQRTKAPYIELKQYLHGQKYRTDNGLRILWDINAVRLIKRRPVFGYGTGSTLTAYTQLLSKEIRHGTGRLGAVANGYLNVGFQLGGLGLAVLFYLLGKQWFFGARLLGEERFFNRILLLAIMAANCFNPSLTDTTPLHLYTLLTVVLFGALPFNKKDNN